MELQDWLALYRFQSRNKGPIAGFIRSFKPHLQRRYSRSLIQKFAPTGFGLEIGSGEQTIAPLGRTLLSDAFASHAGAHSLAREFFPAEKIPYPDNHFDFLLSEHVLEHLPNPIAALREWRRVLKPGGLQFLFLPHPKRTFDQHRPITTVEHLYEDLSLNTQSADPREDAHWLDWKINVLDKNLAAHYQSYSKEQSLSGNLIHRHVFTPETMTTVLQREGWEIVLTDDNVSDRSDSFLVVLRK